MNSKEIIEAVLIAMMVIIFAVFAALIVAAVLDNPIFENIIATGTNTNESLGAVDNVTNSTFGIISVNSAATCSLNFVYNATGGEVLNATGNYTFYGSDCNLILQDASEYIGESLNVTYSYSYATNNTISGVNVNNLRDQFGLFITGLLSFLAIIGTIIGVVWLVFYVRKLFDKKTGLQSLSA